MSKQYPDVSVLPNSGGQSVEKDGIHDQGYLDKKGTPSGMDARFNALPPGSDIDDQKVCDIRAEPMKMWNGGLSYEGDGGF